MSGASRFAAPGECQMVQSGRMSYEIAVVAASLHQEHHQKEIVGWVTEHRDAIDPGARPRQGFIHDPRWIQA